MGRRRCKMGKRGIRSLKTRVGRECSISRGSATLYSRGIWVGGVRGESHIATCRDAAAGGSSKNESCQEL